MESGRETRKLPVRLTREEYEAKAAELAEKVKLKEDAEESLKSVSKTMKDTINGLTKEVELLARIVRNKIEDRDVECVELRDEDRMVMQVVRCDTHDIIETRPMSAAERQLVMFPATRLKVVGEDVVEDAADQNPESIPPPPATEGPSQPREEPPAGDNE